MVIKTASPGIIVNEIDLTRGTSDAITTNVGALCGPFLKGPVDEFVKINTEAELEKVFGLPTEENYEYWWTVSNFLEYGGVCYVVRCDDAVGDEAVESLGFSSPNLQSMRNAADFLEGDINAPYVKNYDHFLEDVYQQGYSPAKFLARNPGTWGNSLGVSIIDAGADYQSVLGVVGIKKNANGELVNAEFDQGIDSGTVIGNYVKVTASGSLQHTDLEDDDTEFPVYVEAYEPDGSLDGKGFIMRYENGVMQILVTFGRFQLNDILKENASDTIAPVAIDVWKQGTLEYYAPYSVAVPLLTSQSSQPIESDDNGSEGPVIYAESVLPGGVTNERIVNMIWTPEEYTRVEGESFGWSKSPRNNQKVRYGGPASNGDIYQYNTRTEKWYNTYTPQVGDAVTDNKNTFTVQAIGDWYTQQIAFQGLPWYRFASRPGTSPNAMDRGARNDELNILVYDATGDLTGSKGNVLEAYVGVSKLQNAITQEGEKNYYADRINEFSLYMFANQPLDSAQGGLNDGKTDVGANMADGANCAYIIPSQRVLRGGEDKLTASLGELQYAYNKFDRENIFDLDYVLQGPAGENLDDAVAKANFLISIAEDRRDCMTFLSPPRYMVVNQLDADRTTDLVVSWAKELSSSSYAVFDSGYKYHYDRFNDKYRYTPLNGDTAGTLVYSSFRSEPWFSPAGFARGQIRNAVKLPFNPSKKQRDDLYTHRVNPVVDFPGEGTVLFGDKTALGYSSAFDRINVRRLFLVVEKEIAKLSRQTLFEFNDEVTRTLFKNNVNPFLRNVQSKRGMYDFLVVCDESNNTPEIIDRNEFVADIYIKPARSINFITLNFIATKTGMTFDEAVGLHRRNSF